MQIWAKNILQRFDEKLLYLSDSLCIVYKEEEIAIQTEQQWSIIPEKENSEYDKDDQQHKKHSGSLTSLICQVTYTECYQLTTDYSLHPLMDIYFFSSPKSAFQHCPKMIELCRGQAEMKIKAIVRTRVLFVETEYFPRLVLN